MNFIKKIYLNQKSTPFEAMFGFFCIYAGLAGIFSFGIINNIFNTLLDYRVLLVLNIIYLLSGLTIFFGLGFKKGNIEAFGLTLLATTLVIRTLIFGWLLGLNPIVINAYISNAAFIFACVIRLITLLKNSKLIENHVEVKTMLI